MLSGEEISLPVAEASNVKALKQMLHHLHCAPPRFRQRLIHQGVNLDDAEVLDAPLDLTLVLQPLCIRSWTHVEELVNAARDGLVQKAGFFLSGPAVLGEMR